MFDYWNCPAIAQHFVNLGVGHDLETKFGVVLLLWRILAFLRCKKVGLWNALQGTYFADGQAAQTNLANGCLYRVALFVSVAFAALQISIGRDGVGLLGKMVVLLPVVG